ncbi:MAG: type III PLP-dependent enzyme, partial [Rhodospirillales bacterium]|nr:type III PLP-dependent enzyme [Rhodospirillales bacterium]
MSLIENRAAVGPLHRHISLRAEEKTLPSVDEMVKTLRPEEPLHCVRPGVISNAARAFGTAFNGDVLYAVKCNPEPAVLRAVWDGGVRHFDCASISEVQLVRRLFPGAEIHFMHPVKARSAIREAWMLHGVRDFVLDAESELTKLMQELSKPETAKPETRPGLFIRLALAETGAAINLSKKFGAEPEAAIALLRAARPLAAKLGLAFHVGSQCMDPLAWRDAMQLAGEVIRAAGVRVD